MTPVRLQISEQTRVWFFEHDTRAYPPLFHFCVEVARRQGAGSDAEDLAQGLLLDLLQSRARGRLEFHNTSGFESYLSVSLSRRRTNLWRQYGRRRAEAEIENLVSPGDAPDAAMRISEHGARCEQLIHHSLERIGASAETRAVVSRIFERYVGDRDIEEVLIRRGLLDAAASPEQRWQERNNENRRQSRAREVMSYALRELAKLTAGSDAPFWFNEGARRISFDSDDVRAARRFAGGLGRCEGPRRRSRKGK